MDDLPAHLVRFAFGLSGGVVLGYAGRRARFCTLGAIEDATYCRDWTRLRAWALAAACALVGTQAMAALGVIDLSRSIYLTNDFGWLGAVGGGLMFGFGMALVGTCGYGTLLRLGGGDLRALVAFLVIAVSAYATMRGIAGMARVALIEPFRVDLSTAGGQSLAGSRGGLPAAAVVALVLAGLLVFAFGDAALLRRRSLLAASLAIGATVAFGWWGTGSVADDAFEPARVESFSFVAPLGEALVFLMITSGARADFAEGAVFGVLTGALLAALHVREFRWEAYDDAREMRRHILGSALMGIGGVMALGCTIGQGITGLSTLSIGSFLALAGIFAGARAGLYWLVERGIAAA